MIMNQPRQIEFFDKQNEAFELLNFNECDFLLYGGAIRGGKTWWLFLVFFLWGMRHANSRFYVIRSNESKLKSILLRSVNQCIKHYDLSKNIKKINQTIGSITFTLHNDSMITLLSESYNSDKDLTKFDGLEANCIGFDEINECQEETLDKAFTRIGSWQHAKPDKDGYELQGKIIATCNPTKNWVKDRVYDKWRDGNLQERWRYIPAKLTDNPTISDDYYNLLKRTMKPSIFEKLVNGDWEVVEKTGKEWLYKFEYFTHCKTVDFIRGQSVDLSFDFNTQPYMTMTAWQTIERNGISYVRCFKEYCLAGELNTPIACVKEFVKDYIVPFGPVPVRVYGDASGKWGVNVFIDIFKELNSIMKNVNDHDQVLSKNPNRAFARDFVNEILSNKYDINLSISDSRCKNTALDFETLQMKGMDDYDNEKKNGVEQRGHCFDTAVYYLCQKFKLLFDRNKLGEFYYPNN